MPGSQVLVTGATGTIGRQVIEHLRAAGLRIRAMTRHPQAARLPPDVEVVSRDLSVPETLDDCVKGVDAVFLVWVLPLATAAAAVTRIASHSERIVFLSAPLRTAQPFFQQPSAVRAIHAGVEQLIEGSGLPWTFLRPGAFAINCRNWWASQIRAGDIVRWFHGSAATAPIHERDIAASAVRALCDTGHHGMDYVLTGPESLTKREQVHIIGDVIGRPLSFEELSPESARREMQTMGFPLPVADMLLNAYGAAIGRPAHVTTTVEEVTGVRARSFREWVGDHTDAFTGSSLDEDAAG
jgi:uncharacterized protein YbjT (DUF2867 family)